MDKENNTKWSLVGIWNHQLELGQRKRTLKKRDRIWASEIGKNHYERYLKMTAVKPDTPYDDRTLRKFAAGNFFERIVGYVLMTSGLIISDNKWHAIPEDEDHLMVSVKPDFVAGGKPDWEKIKFNIRNDSFLEEMEMFGRIAKSLVDELSVKYPNGFGELLYEIKSVNSQVFWSKKDYLGEAYPHHVMQTFAGMKATNLPEGRILYISKDDLTTAEFPIYLNDQKLIDRYEVDVRAMTKYIRNNEEPPKPPDLIFNSRKKINFQHEKKKYTITGSWVPNWEIEWSNYLPTITGCKDLAEWKERIKEEKKLKNDAIKDEYKLSKLGVVKK